MTVEQWGVRVPAKSGEGMRQALLREGALDCTLRVIRDGGDLVFPVIAEQECTERYLFEEQPGREELPRHELVGGIAVMQEDDPAGAARILSARPSLHTVLFPTSEVAGEFRTRTFAVLAGTETTRTEVVEHGHRFVVDLAGAYFSARLSTERQRIFDQVKDGELVLYMFAGVGPFALTLAARAGVVVAADLNPQAVLLMVENIRKNRAGNVIPILADARHLEKIFSWKFDRIIMNLPLAGAEFLPEAFRLVRLGGTIHFYSLVSEKSEHLARIRELGGTDVAEREVRSYSPGQWHTVYDIVAG